MNALVLHSGGLDSTVALAKAIHDGASEVISFGVMYGSLHNEAESAAAEQIVYFYGHYGGVNISRKVIQLPSEIFSGGRSALMGEIEMPQQTYQEIASEQGESPTVVPYRNGVLVSLAAAYAESLKYDLIYTGVHGDDAMNFHYPDCTPEFWGSQAAAVYIGTYHRVRVVYPFDFMSKADIVRLGWTLRAPMSLTWSCYSPVWVEHTYLHCGKCPTCIERRQAFADAQVVESTSYASEVMK